MWAGVSTFTIQHRAANSHYLQCCPSGPATVVSHLDCWHSLSLPTGLPASSPASCSLSSTQDQRENPIRPYVTWLQRFLWFLTLRLPAPFIPTVFCRLNGWWTAARKLVPGFPTSRNNFLLFFSQLFSSLSSFALSVIFIPWLLNDWPFLKQNGGWFHWYNK